MKGKMKASLMVAVMVFSIASISVVGLSSEETVAVVPESVILGSSGNPYTLYTDNVAGKKAYMEFNESAFSNNATIVFSCGDVSLYTTSSTPQSQGVKSVSGINVSVTKSSVGLYEVVFVGTTSASSGTIEITILLTITDKYGNSDLPPQSYNFKSYVTVVNNTGEIKVLNSGTAVTSLAFKFEENSPYSLKVMNGSDEKSGFVYYATGLPTGMSITYDSNGFVIGGKIDASIYSAGDALLNGNATIYAVSQSGNVVSTTMNWAIGSVPSIQKEITIKVDNTEVANGYVFKTIGDSVPTLTVEPINSDYSLSNVKVSIAGKDPVDASNGIALVIPDADGKYPLMYDGTGAFTVTVYADVGPSSSTANVKTVSVVKTITVYVVSKIVDADLDPIVNSN